MQTKYTYLLSDFPNQKVGLGSLEKEIRLSPIVTALDYITVYESSCDIWFKDALSGGDETILSTLVSTHQGNPDPNEAPKLDVHGNLRTVVQLPSSIEGHGFRLVSHNFCDSCTWWQASVEVIGEETTANGAYLEYTVDVPGKLIDLRHGRHTFEDLVLASTVSPLGATMTNLVPTVLINDVPLAQSNEDATVGNDRYTIDYPNKKVVFAIARDPGDTVKISCRYATTSHYLFKPPPNMRWIFEDAEVDLSEDADMNATFITGVYGSHSVMTGGMVVPIGNRVYKNFHDFHAAARRFYGPIPSGFGGSGGVGSPKWTFEWGYSRADEYYHTPNYLDLHGDLMKVTYNYAFAQVEGDTEYPGYYLTVTYYGQERSEEDVV